MAHVPCVRDLEFIHFVMTEKEKGSEPASAPQSHLRGEGQLASELAELIRVGAGDPYAGSVEHNAKRSGEREVSQTNSSLARSLVTEFESVLVTQMLMPSKTTRCGPDESGDDQPMAVRWLIGRWKEPRLFGKGQRMGECPSKYWHCVRTASGSDRIRRNPQKPSELLDQVATARGSDTD